MGSSFLTNEMRLLFLIALVASETIGGEVDPFLTFSADFTKSYKSDEEFRYRREVFNKNHETMVEHNKRYEAGEVSWWMKVNEDMDLTHQEWLEKRTGIVPNFDQTTKSAGSLDHRILDKMNEMDPAPENFDWRTLGMVSSVKDQGGACGGAVTVFSLTAAIESCYAIKGDFVDNLSEQHLLDCAYGHVVVDDQGSWGAYGCSQGWPNAYLDWLVKGRHYNQLNKYYPYTGHVKKCHPNDAGYFTAHRVSGMLNAWHTDEKHMETIVRINPVVTYLHASRNFMMYGGGILNDTECCDSLYDPTCVNQVNHAILVVGYGYDPKSKLDYWIIKNSWGTRWGEEGYVRMMKGTGRCALGSLQQIIPVCE